MEWLGVRKQLLDLVNELAAQLDFAKDPNILVFLPLGGLGPIDIVTLNMTTGEYTAYDVKSVKIIERKIAILHLKMGIKEILKGSLISIGKLLLNKKNLR